MIARMTRVDCDATGIEQLPFDYEQSRFIFIPANPRASRKQDYGTEVTEAVMMRFVRFFVRRSQIAA